jgi:hypothetical protein
MSVLNGGITVSVRKDYPLAPFRLSPVLFFFHAPAGRALNDCPFPARPPRRGGAGGHKGIRSNNRVSIVGETPNKPESRADGDQPDGDNYYTAHPAPDFLVCGALPGLVPALLQHILRDHFYE